MNPTIAAALIAGGISVASFGFNAWTTSRTLRAARQASLRDRQAAVYQQILAYGGHQADVRRLRILPIRFRDTNKAAPFEQTLDSYQPPNWYDLQASVLALCPDSVVAAFIASKEAEDAAWVARDDRAEELKLNEAEPAKADAKRAAALKEVDARFQEAERANEKLVDVVRERLLGTRPPDAKPTLFGPVISRVRSRASLR